MKQYDFVGSVNFESTPPVIFNPSPSNSDEKKYLVEILRNLTNSVPDKVRNGSIQKVISFKSSLEAALKILNKSRHTGQELRTAISNMRRYI